MRRLKIQNLILIDRAEIEFGPSLNILTGETGSGKSAILSAIRLIAGDRADSSMIRKGAELAIIEAEFEGPLFVRREIYRSGKNRCFIDDAQVSLSALKEAVQIEMVDQNSSLLHRERELLDTFIGILQEVEEFEKSESEEKRLESELNALLAIPKERELEWAQKDLELLDAVRWKEEEKIVQEHHLLTHAQELAEKMGAVSHILTEGPELPNLKKALHFLEHCTRFDPKLTESAQMMKGALLELEEVGRGVESYADRLEADPQKLDRLEREMGAIQNLKKRFGGNLEGQREKLLETLERLVSLEPQIETYRENLATLREKNQRWAQILTEKRKEAAPRLASLVLAELKSLNIPHAQFEIAVGSIWNEVHFLFSANLGHLPTPIETQASGGEKSRLLLAIKTILSEGKSTLVFDEIDSNVGGQTAAVIGEKLKKLSSTRQVICVTHFVQVAKCGKDHFLVSKEAHDESAYTIIRKMAEKEREMEYKRMLGTVR